MAGAMSFDDVAVFFRAMDIEPETDEFGSPIGGTIKNVIRSYVDTCPNAKLIEIAEQLDLGLNLTSSTVAQLGDSKYWLTDHFRIFISHVHTEKKSAANLKGILQKYGVTSFVAHEDIVTSDEWRDEILRCLNSMDAMVAILSSDFNASEWTDQEVGFAVCRDVLIIPVNKGQQPYGFISKYQSYTAMGKVVGDVAQNIFDTLATNRRTMEILVTSLIKLIPIGPADLSLFRLNQLKAIKGLERHHWERLSNGVQSQPSPAKDLVAALNPILAHWGPDLMIPVGKKKGSPLDDEIPF